MPLARLPCRKDRTPSFLRMGSMKSIHPLYCLSAVTCLLAFCTCSSILTHWMGTTTVLEIPMASPPTSKSLAREQSGICHVEKREKAGNCGAVYKDFNYPLNLIRITTEYFWRTSQIDPKIYAGKQMTFLNKESQDNAEGE